MTTTAPTPAPTEAPPWSAAADVLVVFGITGDLARVMTFRSLYRLELRGLLDCPIVGVAVDDWSLEQLVQRARDSIVATGEDARRGGVRAVRRAAGLRAGRLRRRRRPTSGSARPIAGAEHPVFYLEIPPFLFAHGRQGTGGGRADRVGPGRGREAVRARPRVRAGRWRPSCTSTSTSRSCTGSTTTSGRWATRRSSTCASPTRSSSRCGTAATSSACEITMAEDFGVRGPRSLLRPGRRPARRRGQPPHAGGRGRRDGGRRPAAGPRPCGTRRSRCSGRSRTPIPPTTCVASTTATTTSRVSPKDSTTETYIALRLEIDNWRWSGVPFYIRTGKRLPVTQTELRVVFREPPPVHIGLGRRRRPRPGARRVRRQAGPVDRCPADRRRPPRRRQPVRSAITLDVEFADEGGEGATPYEVLLHAAIVGESGRFKRQDVGGGVLADHAAADRRPTARAPYAPGTLGPGDRGRRWWPSHGGWQGPWIVEPSSEGAGT